ncbi:Outer membrane lipoprotein Blc like [Verticillium longisporum]|nr:Outer membrane lipoprotein Blc like [Verticillium longisporum]
MRSFALLPLAAAALASCQNDTTSPAPAVPNVVPSLWDGECYYPTGDIGFGLESYLGRWYQVAGTLAPFTGNCKCIRAEYSLNDNGTVKVNNTCEAAGRAPGPECAGPNYIVQDYTGDFAIVQSSNFSTLFILSREQQVEDDVLDAWIDRAGLLGSNLDNVIKNDQTDCQFN